MNALTGCGTVWFDWSEGAVAHPLFDIGWFLAWLSHPGRASLPLLQRHPDAVALLWQTYRETANFSQTLQLSDAMLLALTQRALVYQGRYVHWQGTVPGWRPQFVPFLLRSLLKLPL
jgi:aminoglycoside phosphotransferase (APT) family kinase protein